MGRWAGRGGGAGGDCALKSVGQSLCINSYTMTGIRWIQGLGLGTNSYTMTGIRWIHGLGLGMNED